MTSNPSLNLERYWQTLPPDWPGGFWWHWLLFTVIIIAFVLLLVMGVAGLPGISDMGTEPEWHAVLKIFIGVVAVVIALMEKKE